MNLTAWPALRVAIGALTLLLAVPVRGEPAVPIREKFDTLENWKPLFFPGIARHSTYEIVRVDGTNAVLKASSDASASGLICRRAYDVRQYPRLRWRWRVDNVYSNANETTKAGDDYPMRVYILFAYEPGAAGFATRTKYALARKVYGEYPPYRSLNYVWANRAGTTRTWASPYTDRSRMIAVEAGTARTGRWIEEHVNVLEDYRKAFGEEPPSSRASLAVMNDSDNTGEKATSYLGDLELLPADDAK